MSSGLIINQCDVFLDKQTILLYPVCIFIALVNVEQMWCGCKRYGTAAGNPSPVSSFAICYTERSKWHSATLRLFA